jgi:hypothetical protein
LPRTTEYKRHKAPLHEDRLIAPQASETPSKRAGQIDLEAERLEAEGRERTPPRLVKWAVQATRKLKERERPGTLYGRWRAEAAGRGVDPDALVREVTGRRVGRDQTLSDRTVATVFDQLTRYRVNWRARGLSGGR